MTPVMEKLLVKMQPVAIKKPDNTDAKRIIPMFDETGKHNFRIVQTGQPVKYLRVDDVVMRSKLVGYVFQ